GDYNDGVDSIVGRYTFAQFGAECLRLMRADEPYIVTDSESDPRCADVVASYRLTKIRSVICVPLHKSGRFVAAMAVHMATPRTWTEDEVELLLAVANRCWESIERTRIERTLAQERLAYERSRREEAERLGRMKDEFLATLSHELRTPLNAILGWTQLIKLQGAIPPAVESALAVVERNARVQAQLVEDLLDMNRIVAGKLRIEPRQINLSRSLQAAIDTVRPAAAARGVAIEHTANGSALSRGDPARLQQVFWNLLNNAIKFTPRDGVVRVVVDRVGSHLEVRFADTGVGIAHDFLPYVFERFRQADSSSTRSYGGLGLGLSIAKELVELHGGTIEVSSPGLGKGTTFTVRLPIAVVDAAGAAAMTDDTVGDGADLPIATQPNILAGAEVLVVDDEPDAGAVVKLVLENAGAMVTLASSADEALSALQKHRFTVVVSDIGMPGRDGYDFIRDMRALPAEKGAQTPAMALTAFARSDDRRRALTAGYQSHVPKPVEAAELVTVVASLAGKLASA
ncbi:MAG TPA: ATP-binding protein, partial [Myxococcota bacterium]|nr:ATP-binding protein [Myxococcota bacterium]